jgi:hypothetical protein
MSFFKLFNKNKVEIISLCNICPVISLNEKEGKIECRVKGTLKVSVGGIKQRIPVSLIDGIFRLDTFAKTMISPNVDKKINKFLQFNLPKHEFFQKDYLIPICQDIKINEKI